MPPTAATPASVLFEDGLGKRHFTTGPAGEPLDVLVLSEELTVVPSFESALRARPAQLAAFQHASFSRVRGLVRLGKGQRLGIVSDHVDGMRLSELLAVAERHLIPLPFDAAVSVLRTLVTAVAALQASTADACHGAIAPERIVITPDNAMIVTDYVLGTALEQLRFSPERHWKELRIALPQSIGHPRFDQRADLVQVAAVALALILGRPLRDNEDPSVSPGLLADARAHSTSGDLSPLPAALKTWLSRMLQLVPQRSFTSCREAQAELDAMPGLPGQAAGTDAFKSFVAACSAAMIDEPVVARPAARAALPAPAAATAMPSASPVASPAPREDAAPVRPHLEQPVAMAAEADDAPALPNERGPFRGPERPTYAPRSADTDNKWVALVKSHARAFAIGAAAVVVMSLAGVAAHMYASTPATTPTTGTLAVTTDPAGAPVVIDGRQRGTTPVKLSLSAGEHVMVLGTGPDPRTVHVNITSGSQVTQFYELPHAAPANGQLIVRSDPAGAKVSVDGQTKGVSPVTVADLQPGTHVVSLENDLGAVKENVQIEAGATASLVVPMSAPKGAPVSGWLTVDSPGDVQLFEGQQLLGSNKVDRIMLPIGRHDLEIVNDALGYHSTRTVQINPGQATRIKVDWPNGSLALNALPWADVWVDGQRVGQTPMGNITLPIGIHDIVFRHPELGEQRFKTTVALGAPARVSADLRKK